MDARFSNRLVIASTSGLNLRCGCSAPRSVCLLSLKNWLVSRRLCKWVTDISASSGVKVGGTAWKRRSQSRHFCNPAFPGLKECFFSVGTHVPRPESSF